MIEFMLVVLVFGWFAFVVYMLIHHPETMFRIQKNAQEVQDKYLDKVGGAAKSATKKAVVFGIRRWLK